jgi:steroid 5-alpha reductase family enzyme
MNLGGLFFVLAVSTAVYVTLWFLAARIAKRVDLIDTAWGLGFVYIAWLAWRLDGSPTGVPQWIVFFVTIWGIRLAVHIFRRTIHKSEDRRYVSYRRKWKDRFWSSTYLRIFLVQGLLMLLISSTAILGIASDDAVSTPLVILGFAIWAGGIICEAVADYQLGQFLKDRKPGEIMQDGLWRYSRHPNYFGELASWWGAAIVGISVGQWWSIIGAAVITVLITKISGIPLLEKHYAKNEAFQEYKKHTSILIPLPPKP